MKLVRRHNETLKNANDSNQALDSVRTFQDNSRQKIVDFSHPPVPTPRGTARVPVVRVEGINCAALIAGDEEEKSRAKNRTVHYPKKAYSNLYYLKASRNCTEFIQSRGYIMSTMTEEEEEFPIAYSILAYRNIEQAERLLRAIYRPHNSYCIHIDRKSSYMRSAISYISRCFDNVVMVRPLHIKWGGFSMVQAELNCMELLWNISAKWKYFINLTGEEFPLKTNSQLVQMLKFFNGSNVMEGTRKR